MRKGIEELEIHLGEKGECYEQYCSFLNNTMSKYVIFYNEKNILGMDRIKEALRVLNNTDEDILSQKIMTENSEADMYKTGGMNPNPFYFGRYIFKTEVCKFLKKSSYSNLYKYIVHIVFTIKIR